MPKDKSSHQGKKKDEKKKMKKKAREIKRKSLGSGMLRGAADAIDKRNKFLQSIMDQ